MVRARETHPKRDACKIGLACAQLSISARPYRLCRRPVRLRHPRRLCRGPCHDLCRPYPDRHSRLRPHLDQRRRWSRCLCHYPDRRPNFRRWRRSLTSRRPTHHHRNHRLTNPHQRSRRSSTLRRLGRPHRLVLALAMTFAALARIATAADSTPLARAVSAGAGVSPSS